MALFGTILANCHIRCDADSVKTREQGFSSNPCLEIRSEEVRSLEAPDLWKVYETRDLDRFKPFRG